MTPARASWWRQAESDFNIYEVLFQHGAPQCQSLHYIQMSAEKVAKAYPLRNGQPVPRSHAAFQVFLRLLAVEGKSSTDHLAAVFGYGTAAGFKAFLRRAGPLAADLEKLSPDLAGDGPNPEYPWPHLAPATAPIDFVFPIWNVLQNDTHGRRLLDFLRRAIRHFPDYA